MDFANRYIGGGVLSSGLVQEEIRFISCPELIAGLSLVECLQDNEALEISGFEQYSSHSGYSYSFSFDGDYQDGAEVDLMIMKIHPTDNRWLRVHVLVQLSTFNSCNVSICTCSNLVCIS